MFLIDDILLSPIKGLYSIFKIIHDQAEEELYDPVKLKEDLMHLQLQFEMDQISEEEYDAMEADILERLSQSSKRK
ncbi:MAG: gas vesicle protein GvpG [Cyclobacteriaceae bacterium]